ncbi:MAG: hypothetical protein R3C03_24045 [Pirellulaceae bacterium]
MSGDSQESGDVSGSFKERERSAVLSDDEEIDYSFWFNVVVFCLALTGLCVVLDSLGMFRNPRKYFN